jgi:hypothetical protein
VGPIGECDGKKECELGEIFVLPLSLWEGLSFFFNEGYLGIASYEKRGFICSIWWTWSMVLAASISIPVIHFSYHVSYFLIDWSLFCNHGHCADPETGAFVSLTLHLEVD